jgi:hypothetical protein
VTHTSIHALLEEVSQDGKLDSSGVFTLDAERTLEKMRQFQLPSPQSYILSLVASAAACRPGFLKVHSDADDTILSFDGQPYSVEQVKHLFSQLFEDQGRAETRAVRELAIGAVGVRSLKFSWFKVESWFEGRGFEMIMRHKDLQVKPLDSAPFDAPMVNRIHLRESLGKRSLTKFMAKTVSAPFQPGGKPVGRTPEIQQLVEYCRYFPARLSINGQPLEDGLHDTKLEPLFQLRPSIEEGIPEPELLRKHPWPLRFETAGVHGLVGCSSRAIPSVVVHLGVAFPVQWDQLPPGTFAIVYADGLQKDASQSGLVENRAYAQVERYVLEGMNQV